MANKKISELQSRTPALSDLMLVGDPSSGYSYKCTVTALATIIETDIADGYVTIGTTQTISGAKTFSNNLTLTSVANSAVDTDKFLVLNSNVVNYRTGAEVLSDIGGVGGSGTTNYLPKFSATTTLANSQIFDNGTNIGIATASPDATARVQIDKTDGYGLYLNYNTSAGSGVTTTALYAINTTASSGYAAVIEEKTPNTTAGQYPFVIKHSLSSGTAGVGFGTGVHFQLLDDAGTSKTTQLTIENIDAAAATYKTRYRFNVQNNGSSTPVVYINATGLGVFTASPSVALDVTGEGKFSTINNATTDTDKFLVSDSGVLKYRTGTEVLSDIGAASSSSISGTTNYVSKFTGSGTIGNSQIFDNATNVGIGTNTPQRTLDVNGIITTNNNLELTSANPTILWTTSNLRFYNNTNGVVATISSAGQLSLSSIPNATTDTDKFLVSDGGVVKYRTGAEVLSDIGAASSSSISGTTNYIPKFTGSTSIGNSAIYDASGSVGIGTTNPLVKLHVDGTGTQYIRVSSSDNATFQQMGAGVGGTFVEYKTLYRFVDTDAGERMRLDASGNLGLGTSSPSTLLDVRGSVTAQNDNAYYRVRTTAGTDIGYIASSGTWGSGGTDFSIGASSSNLRFFTNNSTTERMRLDASGNLGLGVTPSAWTTNANIKAFEIGYKGNAIYGVGGSDMRVISNAYYDGSYKYADVGLASVYQQNDGVHKWYTAPSGTAGNAISFTQAMTLDASGRLGIGTTSPTYKLVVSNGGALGFEVDPTNSSGGVVEVLTYNRSLGAYKPIQFNAEEFRVVTSSTERMRITSGGNVGIGTTSPTSRLQSNNSSTYNSATPSGAIIASNLSGTGAIIDIGVDATYLGYIQSRDVASATGYNLLLNPFGGNVGIGTTSPNVNLVVSNAGAAGFEFNPNSAGLAQIETYNRTTAAYVGFRINADDIRFHTGASATERMRITSGGGVAINTTQIPYGNVAIKSNGSTTYYGLNVFASSNNNFIVLNHTGTVGVLETEFSTGGSHSDLTFRVGGSERARITTNGELLINTTSDAGDYKLQVNGNGYFSGKLTLSYSSTLIDPLIFVNTATNGREWRIGDGSGTSAGNFGIYDGTAAATRLIIDASGNSVFSGSIKTAAPSGGTAAAWKLGERVASSGLTLNDTQYIQLDIAGTLYTLATVNLP